MSTPYDRNKLTNLAAQGDGQKALRRSSEGGGQVAPFVRMVIMEVISDPATLTAEKLNHYQHTLGVTNIKFAAVAPRNSIIAQRIMDGVASSAEKPMVLFPFFPPHIALPSKPGEHVWVMFENPDARVTEIGYWFCRISDPNFIEDVNHTHSPRQFDPSFRPGIVDQFEGNVEAKYEFPNGVVGEADGQRYTIAGTSLVPGDEKAYEKLLVDTDASKMVKYEAIPRYRKRPGDTALEGSNNTLVVLGTDRSGPIADYDITNLTGTGAVPIPHLGDSQTEGSGMVDIVAGRGQTPATSGTEVQNILGNTELAKEKSKLTPTEGDPDLRTDRSRIMVNMRTRIDSNSGMASTIGAHTFTQPVTDDILGSGGILIKTDKVRMIARQDLVIMVMGAKPTDLDEKGRVREPSGDPAECASIIIRANGDIIMTPSRTGFIKLGGDDAQRALICTDGPATTNDGVVEGPTIISTMGGQIGGAKRAADNTNQPVLASGQGTFASKVLVK